MGIMIGLVVAVLLVVIGILIAVKNSAKIENTLSDVKADAAKVETVKNDIDKVV